MFVNVGAIRAAETESQLAGVMAHELSHVVMRHSTCNMTKQQSVGTWAALGQLGAAIALGNGALGSLATQGIGMATGLSFLRMSRDYEKQADLLGTDILYDAGYDPRGISQFFETIQAKYGEGERRSSAITRTLATACSMSTQRLHPCRGSLTRP